VEPQRADADRVGVNGTAGRLAVRGQTKIRAPAPPESALVSNSPCDEKQELASFRNIPGCGKRGAEPTAGRRRGFVASSSGQGGVLPTSHESPLVRKTVETAQAPSANFAREIRGGVASSPEMVAYIGPQ
jgi:hypothetical protein